MHLKFTFVLLFKIKLDMVLYNFNPSTQEAETGGSLGIGGQPGLHNKV